MIDFEGLMLDPIYAAIGMPVSLTPPTTDIPVTLTMLDKSDGVQLAVGDINVQTVKPAAIVRRSEMVNNNLTSADIIGGELSMNGIIWRIHSILPKPGPNGEASGEVYLILTDEALNDFGNDW